MPTFKALHGTRSKTKIAALNPSTSGYLGAGIYLTTDVGLALTSAQDDEQYVLAVKVKFRRPFRVKYRQRDEDRLDYSSEAASVLVAMYGDAAQEKLQQFKREASGGDDFMLTNEIRDELIAMGHDGIILTWEPGIETYVAFDSEQVTIQTRCQPLNNTAKAEPSKKCSYQP